MHTVLSNFKFNDIFIYFIELAFLIFLFTDDISHNKIASQSHTYNDNDASKAVDGNTATCMQSNAIGVGTSFSYRTVWWKVDLGEVHNIFSINIQFRNYNSYGL